jgi:hypothetical protein
VLVFYYATAALSSFTVFAGMGALLKLLTDIPAAVQV